MKRAIPLFLAASTALVAAGGAAGVQVIRDKASARTVKAAALSLRNAGTQAVNVIRHPPDGWSTPVNISNLPGESGLPSIAVDNNGRVYATWEEWYGGVGAPRAMCFNTNVTGSWGKSQENYLYYIDIDDVGYPVVGCDPSNGTGYLAYHDGHFAVSAMDIMFKEYAQGVKTAEGWISPVPNHTSDYANMAVDPNDGTVYAMWFEDITDTTTWELVYRWRDPATKQWSGGLVVPAFGGRSKYWREMVIDKSGTAHLAFILRSPTEVWYTKNATPKNAATWTAPVPVSGNTDRDWAMPRLAVDNGGDVYIVWHANTGGYESATEEVWLRKTVSGVWQTPENLSNSPTRSEGEVVAVDPSTKDIYVVWNELVSEGNWEIYLRQYTESAKTWGDIYNMTNDGYHSAEPFIRMDAKKGLHIVYHDFVGSNREIFYTYKQGTDVFAPLGVAVTTALTDGDTKRTNTIAWAANPENSKITLTGYAIYRKLASQADSAFTKIASPAATAASYADSGLAHDLRYTYRMTAIKSDSTESPPGDSVNDQVGVYAPTDVAISTRADRVLFYEIKDNTITWVENGHNAAIDVSGYNVYRRQAKDDNAAMKLMGTSASFIHAYTDAKVQGPQKYAYAVKTKFKDGREGDFSAVVVEK